MCCPQVNDPALRGSSLFTTNQLPGMDMIKQEGDGSRVSSGSPECAVGWLEGCEGHCASACLGLGNAGVRGYRVLQKQQVWWAVHDGSGEESWESQAQGQLYRQLKTSPRCSLPCLRTTTKRPPP